MPFRLSPLARTSALTAAALCCSLLALPAASAHSGPTGGRAAGDDTAAGGGVRVHDIQGSTRISPYAGHKVTGVPGVVTAVRRTGSARGFWLQDPHTDDDPATSEGVFVLSGKQTPDVAVGDAVHVSGEVSEYYPGGKKAGGQSVTQLTGADWTVGATGRPLPDPVHLNPRRIPAAYAPHGDHDSRSIEKLRLHPRSYALDLYESLEGMRTQLSDARVTGPTDTYDELWATADPRQHPTPRGGTLYGSYHQQNGARIKVSSLLPADVRPFPKADVGDTLGGTTAGPLDYDNFGGYTLRATELGHLTSGGLRREKTREQHKDQLSVATYNVENLSSESDAGKYRRLAGALVDNLSSPDVVAVEEVQDNNGPKDDGTVAADRTLDRLTGAIEKAGGPAYRWREIAPQDKKDGGQPGGNIRVAFLYNPHRVSFADRAGGDATTPVRVGKGDGRTPKLSANPGRIAPRNKAWKASRKPLAGEFRFRGRKVFVVANHFSSKGGGDAAGDDPMEGRLQPPARHSEPQRVKQARLVNSFVRDVRSVDPKAAVIAAGDLNDFPFSPTLGALRSGGALTSPMRQLPADERYGYVFNGNSQALDHVLTSPGTGRVDYDIVHVNSEFHDQTSDHDPTVLRIRPGQ